MEERFWTNIDGRTADSDFDAISQAALDCTMGLCDAMLEMFREWADDSMTPSEVLDACIVFGNDPVRAHSAEWSLVVDWLTDWCVDLYVLRDILALDGWFYTED